MMCLVTGFVGIKSLLKVTAAKRKDKTEGKDKMIGDQILYITNSLNKLKEFDSLKLTGINKVISELVALRTLLREWIKTQQYGGCINKVSMLKTRWQEAFIDGHSLIDHQLKFNSIKDAKSLLQAVEEEGVKINHFNRLQQRRLSVSRDHGDWYSHEKIEFLNNSLVAAWLCYNKGQGSFKNIGRKFSGNGTEDLRVKVCRSKNSSDIYAYEKSDHEYPNCPLRFDDKIRFTNLSPLEPRSVWMHPSGVLHLVYKKNESVYEEDIKVLKREIHLREVSITELRRKLELTQKQKDEIQLIVENFENSSKSLSKLIDCQIVDKYKTEEFVNEPIVSELTVKKPVVESSEAKASADKPKVVRKNFGPPLIEDWISDSEDEAGSKPKIEKKTVKPSFAKIEFVKSKEQVKSPRKTIVKQGDQNRLNTHSPRGNQRNWNYMMSQRLGSNFEMINKACYVCGSFDHMQYNCNNHQRQFNNKKMVKPVWNYTQRVNHQNFSRMTHPSPKRNMVPKAVLMRSGLVSLTTARPVNTAQPRTTVNSARPMTNVFNKAHSTVRRPINNKTATKNSNFNQKVNTARPKAVLNVVKGNQVNAVKASACWVWKPKTKVIDHVSKHNSASTIKKGNPQQDLQEKGVIDSGCSRHMTGNMSYLTDFEEIDRGYVVFGGNPKRGKSQLTDESHVLLKVPRKNNMYSVDLKNVVPKGGLTCLFAKATFDESKLWHRRLGHINFKTINKLVKGNLVRGLPSKLFENDETCVACQTGKQHRASYDYNRFSWVLFLTTNDETSGILKSFITGVENLIDQRVKVRTTHNHMNPLDLTFSTSRSLKEASGRLCSEDGYSSEMMMVYGLGAIHNKICWMKGRNYTVVLKSHGHGICLSYDFASDCGDMLLLKGNPKGKKIIGRGTIKTSNLDFEDVYFVRELNFNLFSVSQMYDKKNSVLFNDTECIVLSPNFKLTDESSCFY
ncbi:putative ribonuclease H-like domain-containing protein [Tanacetum coccineum]